MRKQFVFFVLAVAMVGLTSGCIFSPGKKGSDPPKPLPPNDTPENTILRFIAAYEQKKAVEYEGLFTKDFSYDFSNSTDPDLVSKYSAGWFKEDEKISARNLFLGGVTQEHGYQPAASSVDINLASTSPVDDPGSADPARHKTLFTRIDGIIVVPTTPDPTNYVIDNNLGRFFLVRGDAAVEENRGLEASQPGDDHHWYIYNWRDESLPPTASNRVLSTASTPPSRLEITLARIKADSR